MTSLATSMRLFPERLKSEAPHFPECEEHHFRGSSHALNEKEDEIRAAALNSVCARLQR